MTPTDLRVAYQKETGLSLNTIKHMTESIRVNSEVECEECGAVFEIDEAMGVEDEDVKNYINWLENICCQVFSPAKGLGII